MQHKGAVPALTLFQAVGVSSLCWVGSLFQAKQILCCLLIMSGLEALFHQAFKLPGIPSDLSKSMEQAKCTALAMGRNAGKHGQGSTDLWGASSRTPPPFVSGADPNRPWPGLCGPRGVQGPGPLQEGALPQVSGASQDET